MKTLKNWPSKVAHNRPKPYFHGPAHPTAHISELIVSLSVAKE